MAAGGVACAAAYKLAFPSTVPLRGGVEGLVSSPMHSARPLAGLAAFLGMAGARLALAKSCVLTLM